MPKTSALYKDFIVSATAFPSSAPSEFVLKGFGRARRDHCSVPECAMKRSKRTPHEDALTTYWLVLKVQSIAHRRTRRMKSGIAAVIWDGAGSNRFWTARQQLEKMLLPIESSARLRGIARTGAIKCDLLPDNEDCRRHPTQYLPEQARRPESRPERTASLREANIEQSI